jgi:hypothetical protein
MYNIPYLSRAELISRAAIPKHPIIQSESPPAEDSEVVELEHGSEFNATPLTEIIFHNSSFLSKLLTSFNKPLENSETKICSSSFQKGRAE